MRPKRIGVILWDVGGKKPNAMYWGVTFNRKCAESTLTRYFGETKDTAPFVITELYARLPNRRDRIYRRGLL